MRYLIDKLNYHTGLYDKGEAIWSDKEWDDLYFKLKQMEEETGIIYPDSPTQSIYFEKVTELKKVKHNHPMLSLDKTKNIEEIKSFLGDHEWIAMAKMDGLTCSLRYLNGKLVSAETRGNGIEGEDITHNALVISSIPKFISFEEGEELIVDGEIICTYKNFEPFKNNNYKNPRNFASGSIRLLNSEECKKRNLTFVAWDVIIKNTFYNIEFFNHYNINNFLSAKLHFLQNIGFTVVPFITKTVSLKAAIDNLKESANYFSYPIDGIVFKYDNIAEYNAAGRTAHHFKGGLSYKFYDEIYESELLDIIYDVSRNGVLTPVAKFKPIEIDGSIVEKCSLFNLSILEEKLGKPYIGQKLWISKRNQIIPYIEKAEKI